MMDFVAIDFETANENRSSACAIGIVVVENSEIIERIQRLIRPSELWFNPINVSIHGITEEDVKGEPEFNQLWPTIQNYFEGKMVIAHNAAFDFSVIRHVLDEYSIPYPELNYLCTRIVSKKVWPELMSYSLPFIAHHLDIEFEHHNAIEDARACAEIALRASSHTGADSINGLAEQLEIINGRLYSGGYKPAQKKQITFDPKTLVPTSEQFAPEHPFYGKTVVLTGTMNSMVRKEAMQNIVDVGGICSRAITKDTNFLVMGTQDPRRLTDGLKSNKLKKVESLIARGFDIELINEDEFLSLLR